MLSAARFYEAERLECPIVPYDWPFAREARAEIAAHFEEQKRRKPLMFDGRVFLCRNPEFGNGRYRAEFFETSFSSFLAWRDFGFPDRAVFNCFAMAALQTDDGAFLLGEMSAGTANAGLHYFPAGTLDPSDVVDGAMDLAGSVGRELLEETGLHIEAGMVSPRWTIVALGAQIACLRPVVFARSAQALSAEVAEFLARESAPELTRVTPVSRATPLDALNAPEFIKAFLTRAFAA